MSEGMGLLYRSRVGTASTEVEDRPRHIVSFSSVQSELLKLSAHHLNKEE